MKKLFWAVFPILLSCKGIGPMSVDVNPTASFGLSDDAGGYVDFESGVAGSGKLYASVFDQTANLTFDAQNVAWCMFQ